MSVIVLFVFFAVLAHLPVLVSLLLFIATFLLGVICFEVLQTCRMLIFVLWHLVFAIILVILFATGMIVKGPLRFTPYFAWSLFALLLLIVLVLWLVEKPGARRLNGTRIWQALSGWKYGVIKSKLDLAKLCKSMCHHKDKTCWGRFTRRCGIKPWSTVRIQMVQVEESNPEISDVTLELGGQEFEPDKYLLTGLTHYGGPVADCRASSQSSNPTYSLVPNGTPPGRKKSRKSKSSQSTENSGKPEVEPLNMEDLESLLSQRKISDRLLDTWLNPAWRKYEKKAKLPITNDTKSSDKRDSIVACFRRYSRLEGLYEHWAPCALCCLVCCAFLSWPAVHMLMILAQKRETLCKDSDEVVIEHEAVCGTGADVIPCKEACRSFLDFTAAFNDAFSTSNVEIFLVFMLIPVFIFEFSVEMVQREHNLEERIYFRRLCKPKKAIAEVMRLKATLEDVLTHSFLRTRFCTSFRSWWGADPTLAACGPITEAEFDLTATNGCNNCLKKVLESVTRIKSTTTYAKSDLLPYGIGFEGGAVEGGADEKIDEKVRSQVTQAWKNLKDNMDLGENSGRNYKVLFDLHMYTEDSWKVFKEWCKKNYGTQYEHIIKTSDAQDAGQIAHIGAQAAGKKTHTRDEHKADAQDAGQTAHIGAGEPNKRKQPGARATGKTVNIGGKQQIYDIVIPKGFCLTHIFTQAMPDDGKPYHIELHSPIAGKDKFWKNCSTMVHSIKTAVVDEDNGGDLKKRLAGNPIVARFTLSEQYFNKMDTNSVRVCVNRPPSVKLKETKRSLAYEQSGIDADRPPIGVMAPTDFTKFCDGLLEPQEFNVPKEVPVLDGNPMDVVFWTRISVLMGDENPTQAFLIASWALFCALRVVIECTSIALVVPMLRAAMHKPMFPQPLRSLLVWNTGCIWLCLFCFFSDFHKARTRLSLISDCLAKLEQKTQSPVPRAIATSKDDNTETEKKAKAAQDHKKAEEDARPFDLVIGDSTMAGHEYHPSKEEWKEKQTNVMNWHDTVSHLRVFVSTSRLVAQTMLVAAALIIGLLLLMSLLQAMSAGNGSTAVHATQKEATARRLGATVQAGKFAAQRLHEDVGDAMHVLAALAERKTVSHAGIPATIPAEEPLSHLARRLRTALVPAHVALHGVLLHQHDSLVEGHAWLQKQVQVNSAFGQTRRLAGEEEEELSPEQSVEASEERVQALVEAVDMSRTTKTQIFTVVMFICVILGSVPLMWNIVLVNGFFDRHEDLLVKQKEKHMFSHARPVPKNDEGTSDNKMGDEEDWESSDEETDGNKDEDREEEERRKKAESHKDGESQRESVSKEDVTKDALQGQRLAAFLDGLKGKAAQVATAGVRETPVVQEEAQHEQVERASKGSVQTGATVETVPQDLYCKCFEKTLDMAIEAARKSRERFPLKLFGFVITAQLVATWVCLAATPLLSEAKQLLPGLALYSCNLLERSVVLDAVQEQMDVTNPSMHITMKKSLHENVCEPMKAALIMSWDSLPEELTEEQEEKLTKKITDMAGPKTRRLMSGRVWAEAPLKKPLHEIPMPDLRDIVMAWWAEHPSHRAEQQYATGYAALLELRHAGDRLLVAEPMVVANAFAARHNIYQGFAVALGVAKGHLEAALVDEENLETLHEHERFV